MNNSQLYNHVFALKQEIFILECKNGEKPDERIAVTIEILKERLIQCEKDLKR